MELALAAANPQPTPSLYHPLNSTLMSLISLTDIMTLLKVDEDSQKAICTSLGAVLTDPAEELGMLPEEQLNKALDNAKIGDAPLPPLVRAKAGMLGRYCRLKAGIEVSNAAVAATRPAFAAILNPFDPGVPAAANPGSATASSPTPPITTPEMAAGMPGLPKAIDATAAPQSLESIMASLGEVSILHGGTSKTDITMKVRRVQLKTTVDQNAEAEVDMMDDVSQETCYRNYRAVMKGMPRPEIEPGLDQLTALLALIVAGFPPYVDLAIWGNSEFRDEMRPKLEGLRPQHDGTWTSVRIHARWLRTVGNQHARLSMCMHHAGQHHLSRHCGRVHGPYQALRAAVWP